MVPFYNDADTWLKSYETFSLGWPYMYVPVLCGVSRCPDDLCKRAKLSRFLT